MFTLPLPMPLQPVRLAGLSRRRRRAFSPREGVGPYKLPRSLSERLTAALASYRNAEASFSLAVFLARYWSAPNRLDHPFPIDRRALADHRELGITEAQVRGAIRTLEAVGFLDRAISEGGSRYKATEAGLRRKPILFRFGADYAVGFRAVHRRVREPTQRRIPDGRSLALFTNSPKSRSQTGTVMLMGELEKGLSKKAGLESDPRLEAALARLGMALRDRTPDHRLPCGYLV